MTYVLCAALAFGTARGETGPDARLVAAHNRFGLRMLSQLTLRSGENVFFSPYSVSTALAMTWNGASGGTKTAMTEALNLTGLPGDVVNRGNAALKASLEKPRAGARIAVANSLWLREGAAFQPAFLDVNRRNYGAEVAQLDFAGNPDAATKTINDWTSRHTNGRIPRILPGVDPAFVLVLVNAIHFKGEWQTRFKTEDTRPQPFHLMSGASRDVPMMNRTADDFRYLKGDGFEAVSLPYADKRTSMVIVLPVEDAGLPTLLRALTPEKWDTWMRSFRRREGHVAIPRFRMEYSRELTGELRTLGMGAAFSEAADFRAMTKQPVQISEVRHKAFIEVNEEGTEAAAATAVGIRATSAMIEPVKPFSFVADHPFLYAIRDDETGEVIFMGVLYEL